MSIVHVGQIRGSLERDFTALIDVTEISGRPAEEQKQQFLTRALAAYALVVLADTKPETAAKAVVDGFNDNGLDAIFFDQAEKKLFIVQSKWSNSGNKGPELGDVQKFIAGLKDLLNLLFDRFNARVTQRSAEIQAALEDSGTRLVFVIAHTGTGDLGAHANRAIQDLLTELNDPTEVAAFELLTQKELHDALTRTAEGAPINVDAMLSDWGQIRQPYQAFYGQISAADVADWYARHHDRLFSKNLRKVIPDSEINRSIAETLRRNPESFWYFNNGITVLCQRLKKTLQGGADTLSGVFRCEGISVVNGAQTVGSIAAAAQIHPEQAKHAKVAVRFISLENCPEDFALAVTRATNTQNRVESKDFAALDPEQDRLRRELLLEGKVYAYKTGEPAPKDDEGCTIDEATVALACARPDVALAVTAKSAIGKLWDNIQKPPYTLLFNNRLTGIRLWRLVSLLRSVDGALRAEQQKRDGKSRAIAIHGNRFIAHQVFAQLPLEKIEEDFDLEAARKKAWALTPIVLDKTAEAVEALFPAAYVQSLFKNVTRCTKLTEHIAPS